jgi:hypothetical protein
MSRVSFSWRGEEEGRRGENGKKGGGEFEGTSNTTANTISEPDVT